MWYIVTQLVLAIVSVTIDVAIAIVANIISNNFLSFNQAGPVPPVLRHCELPLVINVDDSFFSMLCVYIELGVYSLLWDDFAQYL